MPRKPSGRSYVCGPYKHRSRWRLVIYTPGSDGRRKTYRRSFETEAAANTWKRGYRQTVAADGRTVQDAMTDYAAHLQRKGNKERSIATSTYRLETILIPTMALVDLTPARAQVLYDDLVDDGDVAVDTHRGCLVTAKAFGRWCQSKSWLSVNPFDKVVGVGKLAKGKEQMRVDAARTFTRHCFTAWRTAQDRSAIAALLPLLLNLRASEVAQLVAQDVDDKGRLLWIGEESSKTDAGRRRAEIPRVLAPALLELAAHPATPAGHLFAKDDGEPADRHWVSYHARRLMKAAGVKVVTLHGLRGTHSTFAVVEGTTGEAVARAMGHTDPGMTKAHYIDADAAADAQAERVAGALTDEDDGEHNDS